jgi:hypothetical protein
MADVQPIGQVTHYFDRINVAVIRLWDRLAVGDWIHFYGTQTNFVQQVESMQVDRQPISEAQAENEVAVLVSEQVRKGDWVYPHWPDDSA